LVFKTFERQSCCRSDCTGVNPATSNGIHLCYTNPKDHRRKGRHRDACIVNLVRRQSVITAALIELAISCECFNLPGVTRGRPYAIAFPCLPSAALCIPSDMWAPGTKPVAPASHGKAPSRRSGSALLVLLAKHGMHYHACHIRVRTRSCRASFWSQPILLSFSNL
jgi:hypothetical protein